jgi:hypothetical protein
MPITSVTKDPEKLTLTVVADFPVPQCKGRGRGGRSAATRIAR